VKFVVMPEERAGLASACGAVVRGRSSSDLVGEDSRNVASVALDLCAQRKRRLPFRRARMSIRNDTGMGGEVAENASLCLRSWVSVFGSV